MKKTHRIMILTLFFTCLTIASVYADESNANYIVQAKIENQEKEAEKTESISDESLKETMESVSEDNITIEANSQWSGRIHIIYIIIILSILSAVFIAAIFVFLRLKNLRS